MRNHSYPVRFKKQSTNDVICVENEQLAYGELIDRLKQMFYLRSNEKYNIAQVNCNGAKLILNEESTGYISATKVELEMEEIEALAASKPLVIGDKVELQANLEGEEDIQEYEKSLCPGVFENEVGERLTDEEEQKRQEKHSKRVLEKALR